MLNIKKYYSSLTDTTKAPRTRVKEHPGGNVATSSSRMAFLKRLCPLKKYGDLVDLVQQVVRNFLSYE
jgi:hypothetical protein